MRFQCAPPERKSNSNLGLSRAGLGSRGPEFFELLAQSFPIANGKEALQAIEADSVGADDDAGLVALDAAYDAVCGDFGRSDGGAMEKSDVEFADRRMGSRSHARAIGNLGADASGKNTGDADVRAFKFVLQDFGETADREFR